jgi:hypothetical protein
MPPLEQRTNFLNSVYYIQDNVPPLIADVAVSLITYCVIPDGPHIAHRAVIACFIFVTQNCMKYNTTISKQVWVHPWTRTQQGQYEHLVYASPMSGSTKTHIPGQ